MATDPVPEYVVQSNIEVHTRMADAYRRDEPHYRVENQQKVKANLLRAAERTGTRRMLDIGCGAGFVIDLMRDTFDEIHGIDATRAMLDQIDTSKGNVTVHEGVAEALPFDNETFDLVTAYSVFHHLADHRPVLAETCRVLRTGGMLYIDLEPNRSFWHAIERIEQEYEGKLESLDEFVLREIRAVRHVEDDVEARFGIEPEVFRAAEYIKAHLGGFDASEFERDALAVGFRSCDTTYEWFLGQGQLMHGVSFEAAAATEAHLRRLLPLTRSLFKYLRFELMK
jgi:ubiquinone/menaquinone biosynthesis C-methylase UbiE